MISGKPFLAEVLVVEFVDIITCNFLSPSIFVHMVNAYNTTAACVSVRRMINSFASYNYVVKYLVKQPTQESYHSDRMSRAHRRHKSYLIQHWKGLP